MAGIVASLELLFAGIFGFYLFKIFLNKDTRLKTIISPFYVLFFALALSVEINNVIFLFIGGIVWGAIANTFLGAVGNDLVVEINPKWFGLLNIFDVFVLDRIFKIFIVSSKTSTIIFLFIFGVTMALLDLAVYLRSTI